MQQPSRIHLFHGYGVELEYMIVDRVSLAARPISDELLRHELGSYGSDVEKGIVTWSNELVLHVIELKSTLPESNLPALAAAFAENVRTINDILAHWEACLMPTAVHPFFNPATDTRLWPHESNEVYEAYNRIFDCRGHGWSNLQSTHVNLPFYDDEEFAKLHMAIRLILPLLPALCASSPFVEGRSTGTADTRLKYYRSNQQRIPSITGRVIPEAIYSRRNYIHDVYERIRADIAPFDPDQVLNPIWVNSRGAIPRFDRGSIEIRLMDVQECPAADVAIVNLVVETAKALVEGVFADPEAQMRFRTEPLAQLLDVSIENAERAVVSDKDYLSIFGIRDRSVTMKELWTSIRERLAQRETSVTKWNQELDVILREGSLTTRMMSFLGGDARKEQLQELFRRLTDCLAQNRLFLP